MKNTSRKPYIYKVTNLETHQYYIGSQCRGKIVGHNYFTSSTNKEFLEGFKTYREEKYEITIIKEFDDPDECVRAENYMIFDHMQLKDGLCLNKFCCCNGKKIFSTLGIHHAPWNKGLPGYNKGLHHSEEHKKKISLALKGRPGPYKGLHHSEETKQKIGLARKGQSHSEEARKKMSLTRKGRPSKRRIKISIEGTIFDSLAEASKYYNVHFTSIRYWVKTKKHNAFYVEK